MPRIRRLNRISASSTVFVFIISNLSFQPLSGAPVQQTLTPAKDDNALHLCETLANAPGDPENFGVGVPLARIQVQDALPICKEAVDLNATPRTHFLYGRVLNAAKRYDEASQQLKTAAEGGYVVAMEDLAVLYREGRGVPKSDLDAAQWFLKAAQNGQINAMMNTGYCFLTGSGLPKSINNAAYWYQRAAEKGHTRAMFVTGLLFEVGYGVPQSYDTAVSWFRKAADHGQVNAMYSLGYAYEAGRGIQKSLSNAALWYQKAAEAGHREAMTNVGVMYAQGRGVQKSCDTAQGWFRKAADLENARAMYILGAMYQDGKCVKRDYVEAVRWFNMARARNFDAASLHLGYLYQEGLGAPKNRRKAFDFYAEAARSKDPNVAEQGKALLPRNYNYKLPDPNAPQQTFQNPVVTLAQIGLALASVGALSDQSPDIWGPWQQQPSDSQKVKNSWCSGAAFGTLFAGSTSLADQARNVAGCPF